MVNFRERVHMPLFLKAIFIGSFLALVIIAVMTLHLNLVNGLILGGGGIFMGLLVATMRWFEVQIDGTGLTYKWARFFGRHVPMSNIESVSVSRYKWIKYGGWGYRFGFGRSLACSWPGITSALEVNLRDGRIRTYVFTLREADRARMLLADKL